jgi:hypothetical protein
VSADREDTVALGVALLAHLEHEELSVKGALDRIEVVTTHPTTQRAILEAAEEQGVVEREGGTVRPVTQGTYVRFQRDVEVREGDFSCRRCGASLSSGHFVNLEEGELGPFGSTCIRYVLGRENAPSE